MVAGNRQIKERRKKEGGKAWCGGDVTIFITVYITVLPGTNVCVCAGASESPLVVSVIAPSL